MKFRSFAAAVLLVACGGSGTTEPPPQFFGGDRPVKLQLPTPLEDGRDYPLLVILHGYGASGLIQKAFFGLDDVAARGEAFVIAPDGLVDSDGKQYWNADPACCDIDHANPDDVGYLGGVIEDVIAAWPIDRKQVRVIGHSNGGFMAYRLGCDRADLITSLASLAGDAASVPCEPSEPVHVLHLHGTADEVIPFTGAVPSVEQWAAHNGCGTTRTPGATLDLDAAVDGAETQESSTTGCPAAGAVELWTLTGSSHIPSLGLTFDTAISAWFADHPRP